MAARAPEACPLPALIAVIRSVCVRWMAGYKPNTRPVPMDRAAVNATMDGLMPAVIMVLVSGGRIDMIP